MSRALVVGDLCLDLDMRPGASQGPQRFVEGLSACFSGSGGNTAVALASSGVSTDLASPVVEDLPFEILSRILRGLGGPRLFPIPGEGSTCVVVNIIGPRGARRAYTHPGPRILPESAGALSKILSSSYDLLHVSGYLFELGGFGEIAEIIRISSERATTASLDLFPRVASAGPKILRLLRTFNIVLGNAAEFRALEKLLGTDPVKALLGMGVEVVVVKMGSRGARAYTPSGTARAEPARAEAVRLKGAGDVFNASFLTRYIETGDLRRSLEEAVEASSRHVAGSSPLDRASIRIV